VLHSYDRSIKEVINCFAGNDGAAAYFFGNKLSFINKAVNGPPAGSYELAVSSILRKSFCVTGIKECGWTFCLSSWMAASIFDALLRCLYAFFAQLSEQYCVTVVFAVKTLPH